MKYLMIPFLSVSLLIGCSGRKIIIDSYPDDLHLLSAAATECADSVGSVCYSKEAEHPWHISISGLQEDKRMIVLSSLENAFLERGLPLRDTSVSSDSLMNELEVSVLDFGVRYREIDKRGITRTPWVLRDARCVVAARCIAWDNSVMFSDRISAQSLDWIPGSYAAVLNDDRFSPAGHAVPSSSGIIGPLAVVAAAGSLLALFFITSE